MSFMENGYFHSILICLMLAKTDLNIILHVFQFQFEHNLSLPTFDLLLRIFKSR